jgi:1-acyl-sn-glycerol-3-phosphate acyltransferase
VERRALVPKGPSIIASNHCSLIDPPLLNTVVGRRILFLAKKELWDMGGYKTWIIEHYGAIPLDRRGMDREALRIAGQMLENGTAVGFFPEGTRGRTGVIQEGKRGAAFFPLQAGVPVLPVAVIGAERIAKWYLLFRRYPVMVVIGEAFELPKRDRAKERGADYIAEATDLIMRRIADLLPPERRGQYGPAPVESENPSGA